VIWKLTGTLAFREVFAIGQHGIKKVLASAWAALWQRCSTC